MRQKEQLNTKCERKPKFIAGFPAFVACLRRSGYVRQATTAEKASGTMDAAAEYKYSGMLSGHDRLATSEDLSQLPDVSSPLWLVLLFQRSRESAPHYGAPAETLH
jgi:hypothetical protein